MATKVPPAAPPKARMSLQRLMEAAQAIETPRLVQRWALVLALVSSVIAVMLALAVLMMVPLKQPVPYFLVERSDGSVEQSRMVGQRFTPSERNLQYFAARFISHLLTIDEQMRFNLPASYEFTRGAAVSQWQQFVQQDQPQARLSANPSLRRSIVFEGAPTLVAATQELRSGAFVFFLQETTTTTHAQPQRRRVKFTLDFVVSPPEDLNTVLKNPIGFYVTGFRYEPL